MQASGQRPPCLTFPVTIYKHISYWNKHQLRHAPFPPAADTANALNPIRDWAAQNWANCPATPRAGAPPPAPTPPSLHPQTPTAPAPAFPTPTAPNAPATNSSLLRQPQ